MNIQKEDLFKYRRIIIKRILDLSQDDNIDIKQISIISHIIDESILFYILCKKKIRNKCFSDLDAIEVQTKNCGKCKCHIIPYEEIHKKLIHNDEYYWSVCRNSHVLLDLSYNYSNMIESAKSKKEWWPIIKRILY